MSRKTKDASTPAEQPDEVEGESLVEATVATAGAMAFEEQALPVSTPAIVVTVAFDGVPDGCIYGRRYEPGEIVEGDLAALALREGWAELRA